MLRRIRALGTLLGRDFAKVLARASRARETAGCDAAIACLDEVFGGIADEDELRHHRDFAGCRLLYAECQAERGLKTGSVSDVLAGVRVLVRADVQYRACLMGNKALWPEILAKVEQVLQAALDPQWAAPSDKTAFRSELAQLATAWNTLQKPAEAVRIGEFGLRAFPNDPDLLLTLGEAAACRGEVVECFRHTKASLQGPRLPAPTSKVISLLEIVQKAEDQKLSGQASAWAGEVYRRLNRWDQALEALLRAQSLLGTDLEDFAVEALLVSCARKRAFREMEEHGRYYVERGFAAASLAVVADALRDLLESFSERKTLWLIWGEISLLLNRDQDALAGFQRTLGLDRLMAAEILTALRTLGNTEAVPAGLRVNLARAFWQSGESELALEMVRNLDRTNARPEELKAAAALCRDLSQRQPDHLESVECLLHLQLAQDAWEEAIATGRRRLEQTGDLDAALALVEDVAEAAEAAGHRPAAMLARQFGIEARQGQGDWPGALAGLRRLAEHPDTTADALRWAVEDLGLLAANESVAARALALRGEVLSRQGQPQQACEDFLTVLEQPLPADLLEAVCCALGRVWAAAADRGRARAALAHGWLVAGRPAEARAPLIECLQAQQVQSTALLEVLRTRQAQNPGSDEWITLGIEAGLAIGVESNLAAAAESLWRLLELRPERAAWVEETARHLVSRAAADETREAAVLVQARAGVLAADADGLERLCQWLADVQPPWRMGVVDVIRDAAARLDPTLQGRIWMALGRMLAACPGDERQAAACFEQAAQLDPAAWGEVVIGEVSRLALRANADPGLALATARTAHRLSRGESACGEILRLLDRLSDAQVIEARELGTQVVQDQPASPRALLLLARCESRLGHLPAAALAYRRLAQTRDPSLSEIALADLTALQEAHPQDFELFDAWLDALEAGERAADVRKALLQRVVRFPAQAGDCLERLTRMHRAQPGVRENPIALAEGLRLAGRAPEAVQVWQEVLGQDAADWETAAGALRQLCVAAPRDFVAAALLLRAELRSLPAEALVEPLQRLARLLDLPGRSDTILGWLLEDCSRAEHRAGGQGEVARLALIRRAEILILRREGALAAGELERLLHDWPAEARGVAALCQRELDGGGDPSYLRPLARARFVAGDYGGGVTALRRLIDALPEQVGDAHALCHDFGVRAQGRDAETIQLLGADLAARGGDYPRAAQDYLALARRAPHAVAEVTARLTALVEQGVSASEVHAALAELELGGRAERLGAAFAILRRFLERDAEPRAAAVLAVVRRWKTEFPQSLEPRLQFLGVLFRRTVPPAEEIESEARGLLADFGAAGARRFIALCNEVVSVQPAHAPFWHLRCAAHEVLDDLPGTLTCLRTLLTIDFRGQATGVERHALTLRRDGVLPAGVLELLADLARQAGDPAKAVAYAAEALERPGVDLPAVRAGIVALLEGDSENGAGLCALARCEWKAGQGAAAASHYRRAARTASAPPLADRLGELCEAFPTVALCAFVRGEYLYEHGAHAEALPALDRAAVLAGLGPPELALTWRMLAECHAREQRFDLAATYVRRVLEANPADDSAARRLMELHFEKTSHELTLTREAIETGGETPDLACRMGSLLQARGDYDEAARWYRKVPRDHALANRSLIESGKCRLALNQGHLATAAFKAALANQPVNGERWTALYQLGAAYSRLLDFERAAQAFEELCVLNPDYEDAAHQLQVCQEQLATGEKMRLAEIPFDLLTAWRDATGKAGAGARATAPPAPRAPDNAPLHGGLAPTPPVAGP